MGKYSYDYLRKAAKEGTRIGSWKNTAVYACSKYKYDASKSSFYVLYDDGNKLVKAGYCYGSIDTEGSINEKELGWYNVPLKVNDRVISKAPASGYSAEVITDEFFSRLDKEINKLLADVDSIDLLAGLEIDFKV